MCPPMRVHWRHLANTIELMLPSAHPSPQPKRKIDRFSRFCTAHGRKSLYFTMGLPFSQDCPFHWGGGSGLPSNLIHWANPSPQLKRHLDRFGIYVRSTPMRPNNDSSFLLNDGLSSVSLLQRRRHILWSPYGIGRPYIFSCCGLFFFFLSFFSSPSLSSRRLDVYHTSAHGVVLV